jgi:hypothetical protein
LDGQLYIEAPDFGSYTGTSHCILTFHFVMVAQSNGRTPMNMIRIRFSLFVYALVLAILNLPANAPAEESDDAFAYTQVGVFLDGPVANDDFNEFWQPKLGATVELEMPFYIGNVRLGLQSFKNSSKQTNVPSFRSTYLSLGWAFELGIPLGLQWSNGFNAGAFFMDLSDDPFTDFEDTESELGLGVVTRLRYPIGSAWSALLGVEYRVIYTSRRIEYGFLSVGVSRTFGTPRWLKEFLD